MSVLLDLNIIIIKIKYKIGIKTNKLFCRKNQTLLKWWNICYVYFINNLFYLLEYNHKLIVNS